MDIRLAFKTYLSDLRKERRYWNKMLRSKNPANIFNGAYARGKVSALTFAIEQAEHWLKVN
jgi:hypothetical protein